MQIWEYVVNDTKTVGWGSVPSVRRHQIFERALEHTAGFNARSFARMNFEKKEKFIRHQLRLGERKQYDTSATRLRTEFIRLEMLDKLDPTLSTSLHDDILDATGWMPGKSIWQTPVWTPAQKKAMAEVMTDMLTFNKIKVRP